MIEIYDVDDASFLHKYENKFMEFKEKANSVNTAKMRYIANLPQFKIEEENFILDLISNYSNIYPGWIRLTKFSYVFRFEPDKSTMLPHCDLDPESSKLLKGIAKRVLIYANSFWDNAWGGGTYFAPFEKYGVNRYYIAKCKKDKFVKESTLVENVPGRVVVFDCDELHAPQEFSGNTIQRLIFGGIIIHPDYEHLIKYFVGPDQDNGNTVTKLVLPDNQEDFLKSQ